MNIFLGDLGQLAPVGLIQLGLFALIAVITVFVTWRLIGSLPLSRVVSYSMRTIFALVVITVLLGVFFSRPGSNHIELALHHVAGLFR